MVMLKKYGFLHQMEAHVKSRYPCQSSNLRHSIPEEPQLRLSGYTTTCLKLSHIGVGDTPVFPFRLSIEIPHNPTAPMQRLHSMRLLRQARRSSRPLSTQTTTTSASTSTIHAPLSRQLHTSIQSQQEPNRLFTTSLRTPSPPPTAPHSWTPTPMVTETLGRGLYTSDIFSRLLRERIICLNGSIDSTTSASTIAQLLFLEASSATKPISLYINSPGGSVTDGLAIYDAMTYISPAITTIVTGQAASMASLLLCGGDPGKRFALPHASVMVHQPSGGFQGQASDIAIHAREILRVRATLNGIYVRHLERAGKGKSLEEVERWMERDYYMGAEEAVEMGIVDRILEKRERSDSESRGEEDGEGND